MGDGGVSISGSRQGVHVVLSEYTYGANGGLSAGVRRYSLAAHS